MISDRLERARKRLADTSNSRVYVVIDKSPDGMRSPNLADAVMICYQPASRCLEVWLKIAAQG